MSTRDSSEFPKTLLGKPVIMSEKSELLPANPIVLGGLDYSVPERISLPVEKAIDENGNPYLRVNLDALPEDQRRTVWEALQRMIAESEEGDDNV